MPKASPATPRVLLVDDEPAVTDALRRSLKGQPFEILTANSAAEGLEVMARDRIAVVVSDERMPGMRGSEFLRVVRERHPSTIRLMLSGEADLQCAVDAINGAGVFRFLLKPCAGADLARTIIDAFEARAEQLAFDAWHCRQPDAHSSERSLSLSRAIEQLWMAFQPIVHADGRFVFGYEALVRSRDPVLPLPAQLFAEAEALGRMRELERAIRRVVAQALPVAPPDATIWINLLPDSLDDEELVDPRGPLAPFARRIVFEITERSSLHATPGLTAQLAAFRALGFRIAIDDLGAGYSGLNSFAVVVPEFVKYDRELVHDVEKSPTKARLLASMNAVCRELGITTLAEGVETEAERDTAVRLKCELLQGFWLGRPERGFVPPKRC